MVWPVIDLRWDGVFKVLVVLCLCCTSLSSSILPSIYLPSYYPPFTQIFLALISFSSLPFLPRPSDKQAQDVHRNHVQLHRQELCLPLVLQSVKPPLPSCHPLHVLTSTTVITCPNAIIPYPERRHVRFPRCTVRYEMKYSTLVGRCREGKCETE